MKRNHKKKSSASSSPLSLAASLLSDSPESRLAKDFLLDLPPALHYLRGVVLVLISMGFYYCRHKRRVHLEKQSRWKITKNEKMIQSASVWLEGLGLEGEHKEELRKRIAEFFSVCWSA